jgi:hypothetical protein
MVFLKIAITNFNLFSSILNLWLYEGFEFNSSVLGMRAVAEAKSLF